MMQLISFESGYSHDGTGLESGFKLLHHLCLYSYEFETCAIFFSRFFNLSLYF